ncbi:accessory gene regulator B family protein [Caloranaerobacter ferrireducens]|uniref:accessory gene regulator B family protein n=1 Tax=Caloranaerobacter ferrireducens TaxID=1323370 RepID=UPI00084D3546|nr:accessory gene regulator B family protein [Caloranaerobacter ferrireducens]
MINLEKISASLTNNICRYSNFDQKQKAQIYYGLQLILGILIEFFIVFIISLILNITDFVITMMFSSLVLRIFTGGAHCTSYDRCLIFTVVVYIFFSMLVKISFLPYISLIVLTISIVVLGIIIISNIKMQFKNIGIIILLIWGIMMLSILLLKNDNSYFLKVLLSSCIGISIQLFNLTSFGNIFINKCDSFLKRFI